MDTLQKIKCRLSVLRRIVGPKLAKEREAASRAKDAGKPHTAKPVSRAFVLNFDIWLEDLLFLMRAENLDEVTDNERVAAEILTGRRMAASHAQLMWASKEVTRANVCRSLKRFGVTFKDDAPIGKLIYLRSEAFRKRKAVA